LSRNKKLSGGEVKICLTILSFGDRGYYGPSQSKIQGEVARNPPIILNIRTEQLPAASSSRTLKGLIVESEIRQTKGEIRHIVASPYIGENQKPILEGIGSHIQLVDANLAADPDIVPATDHVERVGDCENVGSARKGGKTAVTQGPETASDNHRSQSAADAAQIRAWNAELFGDAGTTPQ
jgi:hypothetical protein